VIEDAERLLWPRSGDNREAVSSVLNIADGLVGRMLRLHILCSVNARLTELDPAIMRPGRLTNHRKFGRLPRHTAQRLAELKAVPFQPDDSQQDFALAEILNPGSPAIAGNPQLDSRASRIGSPGGESAPPGIGLSQIINHQCTSRFPIHDPFVPAR
jgi:hypothetical protein